MAAPPFRAEHVGSLLRPEKLLKARAARRRPISPAVNGSADYAELKDIEDEAIRDAVRLQEESAFRSVTDGEFRRRSWFQDFMLSLTGTESPSSTRRRRLGARCRSRTTDGVEKLPGHLCR